MVVERALNISYLIETVLIWYSGIFLRAILKNKELKILPFRPEHSK